jgi:hypothetical protein
MSSRLDSKMKIWTLAADLGLPKSDKPTRAILTFVIRRVRKIAKEFSCASLNDLLISVAAAMDTVFEEIHNSNDLQEVRAKYVKKGEKGFANLEADLSGLKDFGITIRRMHRENWEPHFVSVIDCRGEKIYRSYFTKWHELAHLLTLTAQMRLEFRRSHSQLANQDPEEQLMDIIAGELGFLPDFLSADMRDDISFGAIERIRQEYCPTASHQAAIIGIVKALPRPCILLNARLALRKSETSGLNQMLLGVGVSEPVPALRAVHVTVNEAAREEDILLHKQWRVPKESVIARVFASGEHAEATEDLSWWTTSTGSRLRKCPVFVKARKNWDAVEALITPKR